ncbi:type II toxin-antitoxin system RelE/ParE family toxin [[Scytonema hofmanni] UTEX B 1581]|uniref:type II toxin-antitoxin system RelE/ParE family toxin n=1 Tax=[Scytonema hofmanni] UTEX B 1581 TaxID=379535 RepID=UPI0021B0F108|nr:type II toxin-antitoxin system RelE/ParE family toxin [[Scytonema hofmanni] UTEX B 1581]
MALADAEGLYLWIAEDSPARAAKWFNGLFDVIETLASLPRRCPVAPEADIVGEEIRCLLYMKRYRILFCVEDDTVMIYHIRHTAQQWMTREEFLRYPSRDTEQEE